MLFEADESGLIWRGHSFDEDYLDDATALLDEWFIESLDTAGALSFEIGLRLVAAEADGDFERLAPMVSADFIMSDKRPVSFGDRDREGYIEMLRTRHEVAPEFSTTVLAVPRISARGIVVAQLIENVDSAAEWRLAVVMLVNGTQITGIEVREEEDLTDAIASFDELTADARVEQPGSRTLAEQAIDRVVSATAAGEWRQLSDIVRNDFLLQSSRTLAAPDLDRDAWVATAKEQLELFEGAIASDSLATRGDHIVLAMVRAGSEGDFHVQFLMLFEVDESGLVWRAHSFDEDDTDDAIALLDEWFIESLDPANAWSSDIRSSFLEAIDERDLDKLASMLSVDFMMSDKRLGSFGDLDRDGYIQLVRTRHEVAPGSRSTVLTVPRISPRGLVTTMVIDHVGTATEWRFASVLLHNGTQATRFEIREEEDLADAIASFDGVTADEAAVVRPRPRNAATRWAEIAWPLFGDDRDLDAFLDTCSDACVLDERRPFNTVRVDKAAMRKMFSGDLGELEWSIETLAVRGTRLALVRRKMSGVSRTFEHDVLDVLEVDEDGSLVNQIVFEHDDLSLAVAELTARFASGEGAPFKYVISLPRTFTQASEERDEPAIRAHLAEDFKAVDNRSLGLGEIDRETFIKAAMQERTIAGEGTTYLAEFYRLTTDGLVGLAQERYRREDGFVSEGAFVIIQMVRDGKTPAHRGLR